MRSPNDQFKHLKEIGNTLNKKADELAAIISQFNVKEAIVLPIQTLADINKISASVISLRVEIDSFINTKIRAFKKEPAKLSEKLIGVRHTMRMLVGIIKGYSEMVIEDLASDQLNVLINQLVLVLEITKQITLLIDELRETTDLTIEDLTEEISVKNKMFGEEDHFAQPLFDVSAEQTKIAMETPILIVDDSDANCELLNNWLHRKHYNTYIAKSGKQALATLEEHPDIAVILLDIMMPFMDGYEVLLRIKSDDRFNNKMVIMISGLDDIDMVARCIMNGAEDFLVKPFNSYLLSARIFACLEKRRLHKIETAYMEYLAFLPHILPRK
jgi:CheY-like chemotaxis protein